MWFVHKRRNSTLQADIRWSMSSEHAVTFEYILQNILDSICDCFLLF